METSSKENGLRTGLKAKARTLISTGLDTLAFGTMTSSTAKERRHGRMARLTRATTSWDANTERER